MLGIQSIRYPIGSVSLSEAFKGLEALGLEGNATVKNGFVEVENFAADGTEQDLLINPALGIIAKVRTTEPEFGGALLEKVIPFGELELGLEYPPGSVRHPKASFARKTKSCYGHVRNHWAADHKALDFWGHPGLFDKEKYGEPSDKLYLLSQVNPATGEFDEYKLMVGFPSMGKAVQAYLEEMPEEYMSSIRSVDYEALRQFEKTRKNEKIAEPKVAEPKVAEPKVEEPKVEEQALEFTAEAGKTAHKCVKGVSCKGRCISKNHNCRNSVNKGGTAEQGAGILKAGGKKRGTSKEGPQEAPKNKDEAKASGKTGRKGNTKKPQKEITSADDSMREFDSFKVKGKDGKDVEVGLRFTTDSQNPGGLKTLRMELDVGEEGGFNVTEVGPKGSAAITREASRRLKEKVARLPDGVIIRQPAPDTDGDSAEEAESRQRRYLERQGFSFDSDTGVGMGIVQGGKLRPYTYDQWSAATSGLNTGNT